MFVTEQDASSSAGSVGYISYPVFIHSTIIRVSSGLSGYGTYGFIQKLC